MGRWLGLGLRFSEAKERHMKDETVEGAETAFAIGPSVDALIANKKFNSDGLPLMSMILDAVCRDNLVSISWHRLFC
jgi:glycerol-3-phosphate dehydrogenase (NAD(P)+)